MEIKQMVWQHRRDFSAIYECEHCSSEELKEDCYDDKYYHENVIPAMKCKACGKSSGNDYVPKKTKYPEGFQI